MAEMTREQAVESLSWLKARLSIGLGDMDKLSPHYKDMADEVQAITIAIAALRQGWVRTAERVPEGDEHKDILGLYKGKDYYLYDIVQIGWLRLHPEMYPYWTDLPAKPE